MALIAANEERNSIWVSSFQCTLGIKMDAILPTIINNIMLLIIFFLFFETSTEISPKLFMSIVRLI